MSAILVRLAPWASTSPAIPGHLVHRHGSRKPPPAAVSATLSSAAFTPLSSSGSPPSVLIVGGKSFNWDGNRSMVEADEGETDWSHLEADLHYWTRGLRPVQMDAWLGNRKRILVLNREDMISIKDRNAWARYFAKQGIKVIFSNGQLGKGTMKLGRLAKALASGVNVKRRAKGLLPRPVRAGIVGYPNVGKSSLINRLLKRRMCPAAPRPGVTRELKWIRFGKDLDLLDSPGILPMRISDQAAAIKLAICDDIGERSYDATDVAGILIQMLGGIPEVGITTLHNRYKINSDGHCGKTFVQKVGLNLFGGDTHQAAFRILTDFRKGKFGWIALERPPQ